MEEDKVVVTSVSDLTLAATLPANWRLKKHYDAESGKFLYSLRYAKPGLIMVVR